MKISRYVKRALSFILMIISLNVSSQEDLTKHKDIVYSIDNNKIDSLGFEYHLYNGSYAIRDILIYKSFVYLVDEYHCNIKRINIEDYDVILSPVLVKDKISRVNRIEMFKNKLYVFSSDNINFILDLNLNLVDSFELKNGLKNTYDIRDDRLLLYTIEGVVSINKSGKIVEKFGSLPWTNKNKVKHGKEFEIEDFANYSIITTKYGQIKLKNKFPYTNTIYESINVDYDSLKVVFYEYTPEFYKIHIYYY